MRKWITLLMTLLVGCGSYANANTGQVIFEAGYRRDTIDWRHRFPSNDPFVTSNVKFQDIDIFQIGLHGRTSLGGNFYIRANAYWGWILDGDFKRSFHAYPDFFGDNNFVVGFGDERNSTIDDKYVFGIGAAAGYPFYFCDCTMVLAPVIGYAFDEQNIRVEDERFDFGFFDGSPFFGDISSHHCCRNTFISRWYGPFVGVDFDWHPWNSCFNIWAELEYHWGSFRGKRGHIDNFNFFEETHRRSRHATAWVFALGLDYDLSNCWTVGLSAKFQNWSANRHHRFCRDGFDGDYIFDFDLCDHRSRTNHKWRSYAINLTLGREF